MAAKRVTRRLSVARPRERRETKVRDCKNPSPNPNPNPEPNPEPNPQPNPNPSPNPKPAPEPEPHPEHEPNQVRRPLGPRRSGQESRQHRGR
eukprot:scaffold104050_cov57-Phaeocystis_antarctica.AAC.4